MQKRTKEGKPTHERVLLGDPELSARMADALAAVELPERWNHGFHSYPAGLHPDAAAGLLRCFPEGDVLDPFCGGGTVLVEARAQGRTALGRDLSPTAVRVATARTATPDDATLTRVRAAARRLADLAKVGEAWPPEGVIGVLRDWYAPYVLQELHALRVGVAESDPDIRPYLEALLSSILIKVSWRRSDTSAQRVKHHRPAGTTAILFHKRAREWARLAAEYRAAVPERTPPADVRLGDAREIQAKRPVSLILTSPPYPGTYDYLPLQHLRTIWMGDEVRRAEEREIASRRSWRQGERAAKRQWNEDTRAWTASAARALAPGGHLVVVIGDGLTPGGVTDSSEPTVEAAKHAGLVTVARASLERPDHARETTRWEHALAFRKPV